MPLACAAEDTNPYIMLEDEAVGKLIYKEVNDDESAWENEAHHAPLRERAGQLRKAGKLHVQTLNELVELARHDRDAGQNTGYFVVDALSKRLAAELDLADSPKARLTAWRKYQADSLEIEKSAEKQKTWRAEYLAAKAARLEAEIGAAYE